MVDSGHADRTITRRQREVALLLRDGVSIPAIAERLFLSLATVRGHIKKLHAAAGTHDLIGLIRWIHDHIDCCVLP